MERNFISCLEEKREFYNLMSMVFEKEPSEEFCNILNEMLKEEYFPLAEESKELEKFHSQLKETVSLKKEGELFQDLKKEYYDLFFDPFGMKVSPWHSTYTNHDNLLFQTPSYKAKKFYLKYKYAVSNRNYPSDHIALELSFLGKLAEKEKEYSEADKLENLQIVLEDNISFAEQQLLSWIDDFIKALKENRSFYYFLFAQMVKEAVLVDLKYAQNKVEE